MSRGSGEREPLPAVSGGPYVRQYLRCIRQQFVAFVHSDDGTTAVEYAVMLALIIATCITAVASVGSTNDGSLKNSMEKLGTIMGGS